MGDCHCPGVPNANPRRSPSCCGCLAGSPAPLASAAAPVAQPLAGAAGAAWHCHGKRTRWRSSGVAGQGNARECASNRGPAARMRLSAALRVRPSNHGPPGRTLAPRAALPPLPLRALLEDDAELLRGSSTLGSGAGAAAGAAAAAAATPQALAAGVSGASASPTPLPPRAPPAPVISTSAFCANWSLPAGAGGTGAAAAAPSPPRAPPLSARSRRLAREARPAAAPAEQGAMARKQQCQRPPLERQWQKPWPRSQPATGHAPSIAHLWRGRRRRAAPPRSSDSFVPAAAA